MAYTTINKSTAHFNTKLYTGNGNSNHAQTGVGFQPDLLWNKSRSSGDNHLLFDAVRGSTKSISSDTTSAEATRDSTFLTSFNSDGFTVGSNGNINGSGATFANWCWKANGQGSSNTDGNINTTYTSVNTTAGFSISTYTGNGGSNQSLGHGLGATPKIYICKRRDNTGQWLFMNTLTDGSLDYLFLENTNAKADSSQTLPTSSLVYLQNGGDANESGGTHVCYAFAEKTGYSKFGSYTGNGNADGTFVYTGFKPAFIMYKKSNASGRWTMEDNKRDPFNVATHGLSADSSDVENTGSGYWDVDLLSNGFKFKTSEQETNGSGQSYIYMAFAEAPLVGTNNIPCTAR